jgi:hypothetical protein
MRLPLTAAAALLALAACTRAELPPVKPGPSSTPPTVTGEGAGYEHKMGQSRFDPGPAARRGVDGPYERVVGDRGVFLVDTVTRATLAVPTFASSAPKGAPVTGYPRPLTENPDEHTAAVRAYLVGAGVPASQVSGTHVTTTMAGGGPLKDGPRPSRSRLLWYSTHLERSVGGIPVEGSFAFAALDSARQVIGEGVFWPGIPPEVVERARALKRRLDSENERPAYLARVRSAHPAVGDARGEVKIVHTSAGHHGPFEARAVYSVVVRGPSGGKLRILRFDETGAPVVMADERPTGTDSTKRR